MKSPEMHYHDFNSELEAIYQEMYKLSNKFDGECRISTYGDILKELLIFDFYRSSRFDLPSWTIILHTEKIWNEIFGVRKTSDKIIVKFNYLNFVGIDVPSPGEFRRKIYSTLSSNDIAKLEDILQILYKYHDLIREITRKSYYVKLIGNLAEQSKSSNFDKLRAGDLTQLARDSYDTLTSEPDYLDIELNQDLESYPDL